MTPISSHRNMGSALKKVGKIALQVAQFIPGPIGVAARVANAGG